MRARLALALTLAACSTEPSRLDQATPHAGAGSAEDPWGASLLHGSDDDDDKGGGFDLQGMLEKIKDSIEKPGPYEAPEKSKDFDETQVHWGVLGLKGSIVERQAFSLLGGHGTELRELIDR